MNQNNIEAEIELHLKEKPARFQIFHKDENHILVIWKWFKFYDVIGLVLLVPLFFILLYFGELADWSIFLIIFEIVNLFFIYALICGLFNQTEILIGPNSFEIRNGPLPLKKNKVLSFQNLRRFEKFDVGGYSSNVHQTIKTGRTKIKTHTKLYANYRGGKKEKIADTRVNGEMEFLKRLLELQKQKFKIKKS